MNTSLANTLNESSISDMLIFIQWVRLTLTDPESVDVEMNRLALSKIRMACKSVADVINDLLAEDTSPSASDPEDVSDHFALPSSYWLFTT